MATFAATQSTAAAAAKKSSVKAIVRIRPGLSHEVGERCLFIDPDDKKTAELVDVKFATSTALRYKYVIISSLSAGGSPLGCRFDACYDINAKQEDIFKQEVDPHIPPLFQGMNTTIFCYGMTGAGPLN